MRSRSYALVTGGDEWERLGALSFPLFEELASSGFGLEKGAADHSIAETMSSITGLRPSWHSPLLAQTRSLDRRGRW